MWLRLFSVIEVLVSAWLLPSFATLDQWLRKPHIFPKFFAALVLGPGISGVMAAIVFHHVERQGYLLAFNNWATADALGIAATMPLALSLRSPEMRSLFERNQLSRTLGVLGLAFAVTVLIFSVSRYPLLFLLYPVLLFVDSLLAFSGAAVAVVGISLPFGLSHNPFSRSVWRLAAEFAGPARRGAANLSRFSYAGPIPGLHPLHGAQKDGGGASRH
jgi:integral membrane sensor domain MASE1